MATQKPRENEITASGTISYLFANRSVKQIKQSLHLNLH